jgi:RimJ/RimL family protein N-acetyltransferase
VTVGERIEGALVALAPLDVSDAPAWARWLRDPDTTRYLYGRRGPPPAPSTERELRTWGRRALADPRTLVVGIEERAGRSVIGNARLQLLSRRRARFSILIGEADHRGSGQGREATALLCRYAFERLAVDEIMLEVDPRNVPAVRAYEAVGFQHARGQTMRLRRASR